MPIIISAQPEIFGRILIHLVLALKIVPRDMSRLMTIIGNEAPNA